MRAFSFVLALVLACRAVPGVAADLVLSPETGHIVDARVNGVPVRLRVDPENSGYIVLNPEAARRIGLRPSMMRAVHMIGPIRVEGRTKAADVTIGALTSQRRLIWTERQAAVDADGVISPADLPYDRVTLQFRPAADGEVAFPLGMRFSAETGLFHSLPIGGETVSMRISTVRRESLVTAAAGALFAQHHGGGWSGAARTMVLKYDVERPVRPMSLTSPVGVARRALSAFMVRTSDDRGNAALPSDAADPDEIVVTAQTDRRRPRYAASVGLDWLSGCSSLTWTRATGTMTLACLPSGSAGRPAPGPTS